ncbi:MAG: RDD family protein [Ignavibacteriales bacterium]|nr:MAG: RDD family protein [Ignavibacteriales bacterium]
MENSDNKTGSLKNSNMGVIYSKDDHIGLWKRILIIIIDCLALLIFGVIILLLFEMFQLPDNYLIITGFVVVFIYLTILKASGTGTLAYIILKVKVVGLDGSRPSF